MAELTLSDHIRTLNKKGAKGVTKGVQKGLVDGTGWVLHDLMELRDKTEQAIEGEIKLSLEDVRQAIDEILIDAGITE